MTSRQAIIAILGFAAAALGGCATGGDSMELGEGKQEFEQGAQGGNYRFQYVADGSDGYRTIVWRQGESLSDDLRDQKLVEGVVRSVFLQKFCKEMGHPVSIAEGNPVPAGAEGKWTAALRCAEPPPKPKPEKKPVEKKKAKPKPETVAEEKPAAEAPSEAVAASAESTEPTEPKPPREPKAKPAAKPVNTDGPMECVARAGGFDCKPKR